MEVTLQETIHSEINAIDYDQDYATNLNDLIEINKLMNDELLLAMDKIEQIVLNHEMSDEDLEWFKASYANYYSSRLSPAILLEYGADIHINIIEATLSQTIDRTLLFFGNYDNEEWPVKINEYKIEFIRLGIEVEFMLGFISNLAQSLNNLVNEYQMLVYNEMDTAVSDIFKFWRIIGIAEKEPELLKGRQIYVDAIAECNMYCLTMDVEQQEEVQRQLFVEKCQKAIAVIDTQLKNTLLPNPIAGGDKTPRFRLASQKKEGFLNAISRLCDLSTFENVDGIFPCSKELVMFEFLRFVGEDYIDPEIYPLGLDSIVLPFGSKDCELSFQDMGRDVNIGAKSEAFKFNREEFQQSERFVVQQQPKKFEAYLLHKQYIMLAGLIKSEFCTEKSKSMRLLLEAMVLNDPPLIAIGNGGKKALYTAMSHFFDQEIGTYNGIFQCNFDSAYDGAYVESMGVRLRHLLQNC